MENHDKPDPANLRAAAREMWESTPATMADVGAAFSVTGRTIANWSAEDPAGPWSKLNSPGLSAKAVEAADRIAAATADIVDEEERQQVLAEMRVETAVDHRADILARHRQELFAPRRMIYEGLRAKDHELLKMGKTAIEAMDRLQQSERRAWGILDAGDNQHGGITVVIERS